MHTLRVHHEYKTIVQAVTNICIVYDTILESCETGCSVFSSYDPESIMHYPITPIRRSWETKTYFIDDHVIIMLRTLQRFPFPRNKKIHVKSGGYYLDVNTFQMFESIALDRFDLSESKALNRELIVD
ncbi:hypothetical protein RIR_jg1328.t1 [Rhizophagus irregularis DAOM 181602=DAOM 197198]|uniref:Uncharacterized protein n=1 Tax=Rhizophagus irregularis (strain DAOM 181602 / DAOM 197198 / MUCL 43194) TaxID=747089 RepID=U9SQX9_RHIID|nr:hypothetical protein RIR_jg1328.t1 [Rhizophagus irregularis DAOM 181602=DAOM 197198]